MNQVMKSNAPRLIVGVLIRCTDGVWCDGDGLEPPESLLVIGMAKALQRWSEQIPIDTIIEIPGDDPLPDVDELNAKIPMHEWENGLDGEPRPPWQKNFVVYLVDPEMGATFTFANSTTGARIAWERLNDKFIWIRRMRGPDVYPLVRLQALPMKTRFGVKRRPEFTVIEWRDLGGMAPATPLIENKPSPGTEAAVEPQASPAEEPAPAPATTPAKKAAAPKKASAGKPMKPITTNEALGDEVPY
jgi:hypothetical protein